MVIGICDDDRLWGKAAQKVIEKYGKSVSEKMEIY